MPFALTLHADHRSALAERLAKPPPSLVVALCAAWCDACRAFRSTFERLAGSRPDSLFVWLDVEDDSAVVGDIEIEGFPSLAVFHSGLPVFFGVTRPQEGILLRLLAALVETEPRPVAVSDAVAVLPLALVRAAAPMLRGSRRPL
jgi:thioredoxin 1